MFRNGDAMAADSIDEFHRASVAAEEHIAKDEARLQALLSHTKTTAESVVSARILCQESQLRVNALEGEITRLSSNIALRRGEMDQTHAAADALRAPRLECEAEAAGVAQTSRAARSAFIAQGTQLQADVARLIATSNPQSLQAQIKSQAAEICARRSHLELVRASVVKLRAMTSSSSSSSSANNSLSFSSSCISDEATDASNNDSSSSNIGELQQRLQDCRAAAESAKQSLADDAAAFQKQRDELRQSTKRLCCDAEASDHAYHSARREYDVQNDAAAAMHCSLCLRPIL